MTTDPNSADVDAQAAFAGTREVDPRYALDEAALGAWLAENVEGYAGPLTIRQFKGGQSNPTYELVTPGKAYVLRRKPPGVLLPSAHAVDREFTVISALSKQGFPVARPHALCTDDAVIGSMFYVMDKVEGRVFWDLKLPGLDPAADYRVDLVDTGGAPWTKQHQAPGWWPEPGAASPVLPGAFLERVGLPMPVLGPEQAVVLHLTRA